MPRKGQVSELTSKILNLHAKGYPNQKIANELNIEYKKVNQAVSNNKYCANKGWIKVRKHKLNDNYFDKINSHRVAYFFGLFYSDGSVYPKQNRVSISLQASDGYLIKEFNKEIKSNVPIGEFINKAGTEMYSLQLYSEKMCDDLIKHGCIPQKSLTKNFPEIAEKYLFSFLRGYFDGNGCVYLHKIKNGIYRDFQISSSISFNTMLMGLLQSKYGIKSSVHIKKGTHSDLRVRRKESVIFLRDQMYKNDTVSMKRKKEKLYI